MEMIFILLLVSLADPTRWVISVLFAWFVPNHAAAVVASAITITVLTVAIARAPSPASLFIGAIVSSAITSAFFLLRKRMREKKSKNETASSN